MQTTLEVNPHPRFVPCVSMWSVFFFCLLMPLVELLVRGFVTLFGKVKWEVGIWRWIMCYYTTDFPQYHLLKTMNPNPKPCLLPLTCVAHLWAVESTNVGSSLISWICIGACLTHCEGHHLLILNASPINYAFYISLEVELFLNMRSSITKSVFL